MKFLIKAITPIEKGNELIRTGKMGEYIQSVMEDLKPEAAYFTAEFGQRTAYYFVEVEKASDIPRLAEPLFLGSQADVEFYPVMKFEDFAEAGPAIEKAVGKYG